MTVLEDLTYQRVHEAMRQVQREGFLPASQHGASHLDQPLDIGHGQTNSQPTTVRNMLALLDVQPGDRVLDVGSGSGWTTALIAHLTGPDGEVIGVEIVPELAQAGAENLEATDQPWASIEQATTGSFGAPERAPFQRILVSAGADSMPETLIAQLDVGGVMVVPVAGTMLKITATRGAPLIEEHGKYRFVPLVAS